MKTETKYIAGVDCIEENGKSRGSIVVAKHSDKGIEIVKVLNWYQKWIWLNKLKFKWQVWKMYLQYGKIDFYLETNKRSPLVMNVKQFFKLFFN